MVSTKIWHVIPSVIYRLEKLDPPSKSMGLESKQEIHLMSILLRTLDLSWRTLNYSPELAQTSDAGDLQSFNGIKKWIWKLNFLKKGKKIKICLQIQK